MKLALTALFALSSSAAFAHSGAHMHPHGLESVWALALAAMVGGAAVLAFQKIRR